MDTVSHNCRARLPCRGTKALRYVISRDTHLQFEKVTYICTGCGWMYSIHEPIDTSLTLDSDYVYLMDTKL